VADCQSFPQKDFASLTSKSHKQTGKVDWVAWLSCWLGDTFHESSVEQIDTVSRLIFQSLTLPFPHMHFPQLKSLYWAKAFLALAAVLSPQLAGQEANP
jgi:hypothetical protein